MFDLIIVAARNVRDASGHAAILLLGGDKTGNDRWCDENVPKADAL